MLFLSSRLAARPVSSLLGSRNTTLQPLANRLCGLALPVHLAALSFPVSSRLGSTCWLTTTALDTGIVFEFLERDRRHERELWTTERAEWRTERAQLTETVLQESHKVTFLQRDLIDVQKTLARVQRNLNLRTGLEIIAPVLRMNAKGLKIGRGVQAVIDAALDGKFDVLIPGVTFAAARADIIAQFSPSGQFPPSLLDTATKVLYHEVSKDMHGSEVDPIEIHEQEHTEAQTIAAMTLFLFAARLVGSILDVQYTSKDKTVQFSVADLI
ncbi:hypothetical protein FB451DRAFT_1534563 [Mycena latifolia]|nr:hypothetical protein FB451DRAFT_1534563 [Mycena latifolia]